MRKICVFCGILAAAFFLASDGAIAAGNATCYTTFYQSKDTACLDSLAEIIDGLKSNPSDPADHANAQGVVGFLAVIFAGSPQARDSFLRRQSSEAAKSVYVESLYRAGFPDDAKAYADANGLSDVFIRYRNQNLATVKTLSPESTPSDNDLLIGAYMASGDAEYLKRILGNFIGADDSSVSDAIRVGLMQGKFGGTLAPPGRDKILAPALCQKYQCKKNPNQVMHVLTLSAAFWALQSLAQHDQGIGKTFGDFFENDARLKRLLLIEENAFSNYLTLLVAYGAIKDNPNINASLLVYENLGSGQDAINAMHPKK